MKQSHVETCRMHECVDLLVFLLDALTNSLIYKYLDVRHYQVLFIYGIYMSLIKDVDIFCVTPATLIPNPTFDLHFVTHN